MVTPYNNSICHEHPRILTPPFSWVGHIPFAFSLIEAVEPRRIVELGTHSGNSYFAFCQAVEALKLATLCTAIDTWKGEAHSGFYQEDVFNKVKEHNNLYYSSFSNLLRSSFDSALPSFEDGVVDLLHIDGLHTYEAVSHDFNSWLPKVSDRGIVMLHDTNVYDSDFGVWKFWMEIQDKYPSIEFQHCNGLGIVAVGDEAPEKFLAYVDRCNEARRYFAQKGGELLDCAKKSSTQSKQNIARIYLYKDLEPNTLPVALDTALSDTDKHTVTYDISSIRPIHLRFEPINEPAIIKFNNILLEDEKNSCILHITGDNAQFKKDNIYEFAGQPTVYITCEKSSGKTLTIEYENIASGEKAIAMVNDHIQKLADIKKQSVPLPEYDKLSKSHRNLIDHHETLKAQHESVSRQLAYKNTILETQDGKIAEYSERINTLEKSLTWRIARFFLDPLSRIAGPSYLPKSGQNINTNCVEAYAETDFDSSKLFPPSFNKPVRVIIPVYNGYHATLNLLNSLEGTYRSPDQHLTFEVINDCSSDTRILSLFKDHPFLQHEHVTASHNQQNVGFVATVNKGLSNRPVDADAIILNSDTLIYGHPFEILQSTACRHPQIASITPLTNRGTIASVVNWPMGTDDIYGLSPELTTFVVEAARMQSPLISAPTGVGFCMYMTGKALGDIGHFDESSFGKGYGEENDWCQRAISKGYLNIICTETFVFHAEGQSFGDSKNKLMEENQKILDKIHPGYSSDVSAYINKNPFGTHISYFNALFKEIVESHAYGMNILQEVFVRHKIKSFSNDIQGIRDILIPYYIKGKGIEIGALHNPVRLPTWASVKYVDRLCVKDLVAEYPELGDAPLVEPDIIDDGSKLNTIAAETQDFVIGNHLIEHFEDPIQSLKSFSRVLKPGGIAFLTVPRASATPDKTRPTTSFRHLLSDHEQGPEQSRLDHYLEWADSWNKLTGSKQHQRAKELQDKGYSIHFHVWSPESFAEFISNAISFYSIPFSVILYICAESEMFVVLRKRPSSSSAHDKKENAFITGTLSSINLPVDKQNNSVVLKSPIPQILTFSGEIISPQFLGNLKNVHAEINGNYYPCKIVLKNENKLQNPFNEYSFTFDCHYAEIGAGRKTLKLLGTALEHKYCRCDLEFEIHVQHSKIKSFVNNIIQLQRSRKILNQHITLQSVKNISATIFRGNFKTYIASIFDDSKHLQKKSTILHIASLFNDCGRQTTEKCPATERDRKIAIDFSKLNERTLIIDHAIGGGANQYRQERQAELISKKGGVCVLVYDIPQQSYLIYLEMADKITAEYYLHDLHELKFIYKKLSISHLIFNNIVTFPHPLQLLEQLDNIHSATPIRTQFLIHDYYALCPTVYLLGLTGHYCNAVEGNQCTACLADNTRRQDVLGAQDILRWRKAFRSFMSQADVITCFSESSKSIVQRAYPELSDKKIRVQPHNVSPLRLVKHRGNPNLFTVAVIGELVWHKGEGIIADIVQELNNGCSDSKIRILHLGGSCTLPQGQFFRSLGHYEREKLPDIAEKYDIDLFFVASVCPETFSFTTHEVIQMGLPLMVFDLGAPAAMAKKYKHGIVLKNISATDALAAINDLATPRKQQPAS